MTSIGFHGGLCSTLAPLGKYGWLNFVQPRPVLPTGCRMNASLGYAERFRNVSKGVSLSAQPTHKHNLLLSQKRVSNAFSSMVMSKHGSAMGVVLHKCHILKIIGVVIGLVAIFVVDVLPLRDRPNERQGDQLVNPPLSRNSSLVKLDSLVSIPVCLLTEYFGGPCSPHPIPSLQAPNLSSVANLIKPLVSNHVSPFFLHLFTQSKTPRHLLKMCHQSSSTEAFRDYSLLSILSNCSIGDNLNYTRGRA